MILRSSLEAEAAFASRLSQRLHAPVITEPAAVEDYGFDALLAGLLGQRLADECCHLALLLALGGRAHVRARVRRRDQRVARAVVDDLDVDVVETAEHSQTRSIRRAGDGLPHAHVAASAGRAWGFGSTHRLSSYCIP